MGRVREDRAATATGRMPGKADENASNCSVFLYNPAAMPIEPAFVRPADLAAGLAKGAARDGLAVTGSTELSVLGRIQPPYRNRGRVEVALHFERHDAPRVFRLRGEMTFDVAATCQRCLDEMRVEAAEKVDVAIVERAADVPAGEVVDDFVVLDGTPLDVLAAVEDELLLALPIAPRHPEGVCEPAVQTDERPQDDETTTPNPFSVLEILKDDDT